MERHRPSSFAVQGADFEGLEPIRGLLETCGLPHDDLTPAHLNYFLVARDGMRLCGAVGIEPCGDAALLRSLAVAPDARGQGLGTRLVEAIEQRARQKGIRTLYLLTATAAPFFRDHEYETIEREALPEDIRRTEEAARLCPVSAVCMRKPLRASAEGDTDAAHGV